MCASGVLVHCPSRLGAAVPVVAAEIPRRDRMLTKWTLERAKTIHHCDRVISHTFKGSRISRCEFEPKSLSTLVGDESPVSVTCRRCPYADRKGEFARGGRAFRASAFPSHASYCV
jgi:hypothetical protein